MTNFIEKKIEEFNKRFANPTAKYLGNDFDNYPKANIKDANDFLRQALTQQLEKIEQMIVDEILICHKENTPTSRLTSLMMKIKEII